MDKIRYSSTYFCDALNTFDVNLEQAKLTYMVFGGCLLGSWRFGPKGYGYYGLLTGVGIYPGIWYNGSTTSTLVEVYFCDDLLGGNTFLVPSIFGGCKWNKSYQVGCFAVGLYDRTASRRMVDTGSSYYTK